MILRSFPSYPLRYSVYSVYGYLSLAIVGSLILGSGLPATATITQATITEILDGTEVFIENQRVGVNAIAQAQQQIRTGASRVELQFNTGATGRLSQNSQMIVAGECFNIQQGTILVNGSANGCTRSRRLSVRGTTYLLEIEEDEDIRIIVLEGEVEVSPVPEDSEETEDTSSSGLEGSQRNKQDKQLVKFPRIPIFRSGSEDTPEEGDDEEEADFEEDTFEEDTFILASGQKVRISRAGRQGRIEKLSQSEFESILNSRLFRGFRSELPGMRKIRGVFQRLFPGVSL